MYTDQVANLTITVPDDLLQRARARAAREGTSVSSVLRSSLKRYVDDEAEVGEAWDRFLDIARRAGGHSSSGRRGWRRDDLQRALGPNG
jgi:post-segregation antitoxin (ccd killing protein)